MPEVIHGFGDKRKPFPTANIRGDYRLGVYFCETNYGYGMASCIRTGELEVYIFGLNQDIYGEELDIIHINEFDKELFLKIGLLINDRGKDY